MVRIRFAAALLLVRLAVCLVGLLQCTTVWGKVDFSASRTSVVIEGWQVRSDSDDSQTNAASWQPIATTDSWEPTLGYRFDGQATFRTALPAINHEKSGRILLHFDAVATFAEVYLDGQSVGQHLGGWADWRIDITDRYKPGAELLVRVEERPGHNTQGFLPVFLPHFGGIWQPVRVIATKSESFIDDLQLLAAGWTGDAIDVEVKVNCPSSGPDDLQIGVRIVEPQDAASSWEWKPIAPKSTASFHLAPKTVHRWSPDKPVRYKVEVVLGNRQQAELDRLTTHAAIRRIETRGRELWLNGSPISLRGVLNWGYAPPRIAPSLDVEFMKRELSMLRDQGFNLMKFCLWFPPDEYLELCDEMGVLAWVEYPTWHPKLTQEYLADLKAEYEEFFHADRNHPSIILRSLTCETGHSAELEVIRNLYDRAHQLIPGAIVEDDSSWIGWHRIHDFYDDHPYGNNHTWRETLAKLESHIAERDPKPLMLGEAIAADTWTNAEAMKHFSQLADDPNRLHSAAEIEATRTKLLKLTGPKSVQAIEPDSLQNALAMRKFQIERYRQQMPRQGYVVSVIRDFPFAAMGLVDFRGNPKWDRASWSWHGHRMLTLETDRDCRSFASASTLSAGLYGIETLDQHTPKVTLHGPFGTIEATLAKSTAKADSVTGQRLTMGLVKWELSLSLPKVDDLTRSSLVAELGTGDDAVRNAWPIWIVPSEAPVNKDQRSSRRTWYVHEEIANDPDWSSSESSSWPRWNAQLDPSRASVLARRLDLPLLDWMKRGGHVALIPNGQHGSFPAADHWFLRGGVVVHHEALQDDRLCAMLSELQTFDLAGPVMMAPDYLEETTPLAMLWDNHDRKDFRIHALAWMAKVEQGRLAVSTLQPDGRFGAAGPYVLDRIRWELDHATDVQALSSETIERLLSDLNIELIEVPRDEWSFMPDKQNRGKELGWEKPQVDRGQWKSIRVGTHWDSQGYGDVDGWAWYAKRLSLRGDARYLTFTGVDDYFEVFVDGQLCGTGGDRVNKKTAFDQTITIALPENAIGQEQIELVVHVEDWQGAGGIFRPIFVSNEPPPDKPAILIRKTQSP